MLFLSCNKLRPRIQSKMSMIREDFNKKVEENEEHKKENILVQENQPKRSKKDKKFTPDEKEIFSL